MKNPSIKEAVNQAIDSWPLPVKLARFALKRHGFGITYPKDLDDGEEKIPEGFIEVYGFWGKPDGYEILVSETEYLNELAARLKTEDFEKESADIISLKQKL